MRRYHAELGTALAVAFVGLTCLFTGCSQSRDGYINKGNVFFSRGQYQDASLNYRNAIRKDPNFAIAYQKLGLSDFAQGKVADAAAALTRAHRIEPQNQSILEDLADVTFNRYLLSGRPKALYDSVTGMVSQILKTNPKSIPGMRLQASLLYGDGKLQDAIVEYQKINSIHPDDPAILLPLADALRLANRSSEAEALAVHLTERKPDFAPGFQWLEQVYMATGRPAEAEKIYRARLEKNPKDASAILDLAGFLRGRGQAKAASDLINGMTARAADFPNRYALAGDFYQSGRNWPDAERAYKAGLDAEPKRKNAYLRSLASVYLNQKRNDEALKVLNEAAQHQPDDLDARAARIDVLIRSAEPKQIDEAITDSKDILKKQPRDARFAELLARAYAAKGDARSAAAGYQDAARIDSRLLEPRLALAQISKNNLDFRGMQNHSEQALAIDPRNLRARLFHAEALMGQGKSGEADHEMQLLERDYPDSVDVRIDAGEAFIAQNRAKAAIDAFKAILAKNPNDERALAGLATAYIQNRSFNEAVQLLTGEIARNPAAADTNRLMLARVAARVGKADVALQQYQALSKEHPDSADYQFQAGLLSEYLGDKKNAVSSFEAAARLEPQDAIKAGELALAYRAAGMDAQADAAYARSVSLNSSDPSLLNNRAYFLAETGRDPQEAVRLAQTALQKSPANPAIMDTLALGYIRSNLADNAMGILNKLVREHPQEPMYRYHLGMAFARKGDRARARKEIETSLSEHPSQDDAAKIREFLASLG